jgi:DNA-3-methyladenine glycosylase II
MTDWADDKLSELRERYGEKELEKSEKPFQRLVESIINQQLSTDSASAIRERVFRKFTIDPENILEVSE